MIVILYVVDALRPDHMSCYGYNRKTTPNIDNLCDTSSLFTNAYAQSTWTRASSVSILTSMYPSSVGVQQINDVLPKDVLTLPEILKENGFYTIGISANANVSSYYGYDKGFDEYIDLFMYDDIEYSGLSSPVREKVNRVHGNKLIYPRGEEINNILLKNVNLNNINEKDIFIFIWTIDTHPPFNPPKEFRKFSLSNKRKLISIEEQRRLKTPEDRLELINLYDDEVFYMDHCFGNLLKILKENNVYDDALICFTSDHGQLLLEHGLIGHGNMPYQESIRVPLIIKSPGSEKKINDDIIGLIDIFPTVLDICDLSQYYPFLEFDGYSILPIINNEKSYPERDIFSETKSWNVQSSFYSILSGEWKYIKTIPPKKDRSYFLELIKYFIYPSNVTEFMRNPKYFIKRRIVNNKELLFNLSNDPHECVDLSENNADILSNFQDKWTYWLNRCKTKNKNIKDTRKKEPEDKVLEHLRALGYIE